MTLFRPLVVGAGRMADEGRAIRDTAHFIESQRVRNSCGYVDLGVGTLRMSGLRHVTEGLPGKAARCFRVPQRSQCPGTMSRSVLRQTGAGNGSPRCLARLTRRPGFWRALAACTVYISEADGLERKCSASELKQSARKEECADTSAQKTD
ncbi:hypothetical protein NDU88_007025 [Pleurodeles waltl]|uniref:Uncharacterized protein n=1 Tax=Pleurodeles waltl TaxID=8319 RepID=A0AAV7MFN2_PLEWA|nr:hypothetical protein NDU88_007025 [Pleurodeles waltl]